MEPTNKISLWTELKLRWKAESPLFWQRMLKFAISLGTGAVAFITADQVWNFHQYGIPQIVFNIAGYIIAASTALGLSAKITTK